MNDNDDEFNAFRQAALDLGFRTIGAEFDGSNDEGSVHTVGIPADHTNVTLEAKALEDVKETPVSVHGTKHWVSGKGWVPNERSQQLIGLAGDYGVDLATVFYDILESFPGDWVNNEGGYGTVWLDLVTGEYWINGNQRITSTEEAIAEGAYAEPLMGADTDLVRQMRNLLTA